MMFDKRSEISPKKMPQEKTALSASMVAAWEIWVISVCTPAGILPKEPGVPNSMSEVFCERVCDIATFALEGMMLLAATPVVRLVPREEMRMEPMMAEPSDVPTWRKVFDTPAASPASRGETAERARLLVWPMMSPMPKPKSMKPGAKDHCDEPKCKVSFNTKNPSMFTIIPIWTMCLG